MVCNVAEKAPLVSLALGAGLIGPAFSCVPVNCQNDKIGHRGGRSSSPLTSRSGKGLRAAHAAAPSQTKTQNRMPSKGASALRSASCAAPFPPRNGTFSRASFTTAAQWAKAGSSVRGKQAPRKAQKRCIAGSTHHAWRAPFLGFSGVEIGVCVSPAAQARR